MTPLASLPSSPPSPSRSNSTASGSWTSPSPPRSPPRSTRIPLALGGAQRFRTIGRASLERSQHTATSSSSPSLHSLSMHQVAHPPSPPDTIRSASPSRGPSAGDDEERREMEERERERNHDRIAGGIGVMSSVKALQERERAAVKGVRRQSLGYSFSTPNRAGLEPQRQRVGPKKWLVLVVPPAVLPHSPPPSQTSGFANGYGASGRFAGGILLSLQPTLPAQLALIAREFSLPSLGGVSLYLCLPDSMAELAGTKPRLMDETWSILWHGHFDEENQDGIESMKGVGGLPIAARLEFDIDARKARWLSSWTSGAASSSVSPPLGAAGPFLSDRSKFPTTHSASASTSSTTSTATATSVTATLEPSSFVERGTPSRPQPPRPLSLLATRRSPPPPALSPRSLNRNNLVFWPKSPIGPASPDLAPVDSTSLWMGETLAQTARITFDPAKDEPVVERKPSRKTLLVERDWDTKVVPLSEISGTPTPGPEESTKTFFGQPKLNEQAALDTSSPGARPTPKDAYPRFALYPAVYPRFSLYPATRTIRKPTPIVVSVAPTPRATRQPEREVVQSPVGTELSSGASLAAAASLASTSLGLISPWTILTSPEALITSLPILGLGLGPTTLGFTPSPTPSREPSASRSPTRLSRAVVEDHTFEGAHSSESVVAGLGLGGSGISWMDSPASTADSAATLVDDIADPAHSTPSKEFEPLVLGLGMGGTTLGWEGEEKKRDSLHFAQIQPRAARTQVDLALERATRPDSIVLGLGLGPSTLAWMDGSTNAAGPGPLELDAPVVAADVLPAASLASVPVTAPVSLSPSVLTKVFTGHLSYPWNLSVIYAPAYPHLAQRHYPRLSPAELPSRWSTDLRTRLPTRYPFINIYPSVYPHVKIYPSLSGSAVAASNDAPTVRRPSIERRVPIPLVLSPNPMYISSSYPSTAASPDRLESASLEARLRGSGSLDTGEMPERQFPAYDSFEQFDKPTAPLKLRKLVERDPSVQMVSLADASLPSPTSSTYSDRAEQPESDVEDPDSEPEHENGDYTSEYEQNELSLNAPSSPAHNYSALFLPPPTSPAFHFSGTPSPTIVASQMSSYDQYATAAGHPDEVPFVLSPGLGAALGFEDESPLPQETKFFEDEDDSSEEDQYLVLSPAAAPSPSDSPKLSPDPLAPVLFTFPATSESDDLAAAVAQYVIEAQTQSIQRRGRFCCALSGGSMPKILAEGLLNDDRLRWDKWEVFFVDERLVPLDSAESTFKAYGDALFSKVPIPAWQIHSIKSLPDLTNVTLPAEAAEEIASDMETQLLASFPDVSGPGLVPGPPKFDLVLLGMGADGHCASLFPGHALLSERDWWVAYLNDSPKPPLSRITFTLPLLSAARRLAFVCTGAEKAAALANALDQGIPRDAEDKVPAGRVVLDGHPIVWFTDADARAEVDYPTSSFWNEDDEEEP